MEQKLISVVIPAYNAEDSIEKCIKSIKDEEVEIIIVIDGATDKTEEICDEIAKNDKRVKLIKQENQGCINARNNGVLKATGRYVMFLDSDDSYTNETISEIKNLINKYNEPDLIRFRYRKEPEGYEQYRYFETDEEEYIEKENFKEKIYPMILEGYQLNAIWSNCVKKEKLLNIKLTNHAKSYGEDLLVNLELYTQIDNMVVTEKILYKYYTNPKSITRTKNIDKLLINLQDCINVYSSLYIYLKKWDMDNSKYQEIVRNRLKKETDVLINIIKEEMNKDAEKLA